MTVETTTIVSGPFIGNGLTTNFPRDFPIADAGHVVVEVNGIEINGGFSALNPEQATGDVVFDVAPVDGDRIFLTRRTPALQGTDYSSQGAVSPEQIESDVDYRTLVEQENRRDVERTILLPLGSAGLSLTPIPAGSFVAADEDGNLIAGGNASDISNAISSAESALLSRNLSAASQQQAAASAAQVTEAVEQLDSVSFIDDVQDLIEDELLTYVQNLPRSVEAGDFIFTKRALFNFKVAPAAASDNDLTTAGGVKLYVQPNKDGTFSAEAFGAVGDGDGSGGGTNNFTALNKAFAKGVPVDLANRIFRCDTALDEFTGEGRAGFINGSLDFTNCTDQNLIRITGDAYFNEKIITQNVTYPANVIRLNNTTGISAGDVITLSSNKPWGFGGALHSEFAVVDEVLSSTGIRVEGQIYADYRTGDSPRCHNVSRDTRCHFDNFKMIGGGDNASNHRGITINRVAHGVFGTVYGEKLHDRFLQILDCIFLSMVKTVGISSDREGLGYIITAAGGQWNHYGDIISNNSRHPFTGGNFARMLRFFSVGDVIGTNCRDAVFDTHDGCADYTVNSITGSMKQGNLSDDAVTIQSPRCYIGPINVSGTVRNGLLLQHTGFGDNNREAFYKFASVSIEPDANGSDAGIVIDNLDSVDHRQIDYVEIDCVVTRSDRGIVIDPSQGDIKKVLIKGGTVKAENGHGAFLTSTANYKIGKVTFIGLTLKTFSTATTVHPLLAFGDAYHDATGNVGIEKIKLVACEMEGGASHSMRVIDANLSAVLHDASGFGGVLSTSEGPDTVVVIDGDTI